MPTEIKQLMKRIDNSKYEGVLISNIQDDYGSAVGQIMIIQLTDSGLYVQRQVPLYSFDAKWRIFLEKFKPY